MDPISDLCIFAFMYGMGLSHETRKGMREGKVLIKVMEMIRKCMRHESRVGDSGGRNHKVGGKGG